MKFWIVGQLLKFGVLTFWTLLGTNIWSFEFTKVSKFWPFWSFEILKLFWVTVAHVPRSLARAPDGRIGAHTHALAVRLELCARSGTTLNSYPRPPIIDVFWRCPWLQRQDRLPLKPIRIKSYWILFLYLDYNMVLKWCSNRFSYDFGCGAEFFTCPVFFSNIIIIWSFQRLTHQFVCDLGASSSPHSKHIKIILESI